MTQEFTHTVHSAKEYREAVKHANALGFEVSETYAGGHWDAEGCPAWPRKCEIRDVGHKYFKIPLYDDEKGETVVFDCEPQESIERDGYLKITFRKS